MTEEEKIELARIEACAAKMLALQLWTLERDKQRAMILDTAIMWNTTYKMLPYPSREHEELTSVLTHACERLIKIEARRP